MLPSSNKCASTSFNTVSQDDNIVAWSRWLFRHHHNIILYSRTCKHRSPRMQISSRFYRRSHYQIIVIINISWLVMSVHKLSSSTSSLQPCTSENQQSYNLKRISSRPKTNLHQLMSHLGVKSLLTFTCGIKLNQTRPIKWHNKQKTHAIFLPMAALLLELEHACSRRLRPCNQRIYEPI